MQMDITSNMNGKIRKPCLIEKDNQFMFKLPETKSCITVWMKDLCNHSTPHNLNYNIQILHSEQFPWSSCLPTSLVYHILFPHFQQSIRTTSHDIGAATHLYRQKHRLQCAPQVWTADSQQLPDGSPPRKLHRSTPCISTEQVSQHIYLLTGHQSDPIPIRTWHRNQKQ